MNSETRLKFRVENRVYDLRRPRGCTVLIIERQGWEGNEFWLWLPEAALSWVNWEGDKSIQNWEILPDGKAQWRHSLKEADLVSTLSVDQKNDCLWYSHEITNTSDITLKNGRTLTCFHLVNAPEFISIHGERLWACLNGKWITIDKVQRTKSSEPQKLKFLRAGPQPEHAALHPMFTMMPQAVCHPLFIAESFDRRKSVGIACKDMGYLLNNNDYILRCLHSEPLPIKELLTGMTARVEGIILFCDSNHQALLKKYNRVVPKNWWNAQRDD